VCSVLHRYESIIATLCDSLDSLDEPEARASMVWIIGEYAERIDNADELLESFLEVCLCTMNGSMCYCFSLQAGDVTVIVNPAVSHCFD